MRLTMIAFAVLPIMATAQETTTPAQPAQTSQSCAVGTVWDGVTQTCLVAEQQQTPIDVLPAGRSNCSGHAQSVTS